MNTGDWPSGQRRERADGKRMFRQKDSEPREQDLFRAQKKRPQKPYRGKEENGKYAVEKD